MKERSEHTAVQQPGFVSVRFKAILAVTWIGYAAVVAARKPFSLSRARMQKEGIITVMESSNVDTAFLLMYTVGQMFYGKISARMSGRQIILLALAGSAASLQLASSCYSATPLVILMGILGLFQSVSFPSCINVVSPWLASFERGYIMGVWGSQQAVGGLLGAFGCSYLLKEYSWRSTFNGCAVALGATLVYAYFYLGKHPNSFQLLAPAQTAKGLTHEALFAGQPRHGGTGATPSSAVAPSSNITKDGEIIPVDEEDTFEARTTKPVASSTNSSGMSFLEVVRLPGVLGLCSCHFLLKIVRYSLLFWLPYYFSTELKMSDVTSGYVYSAFDLGGVVGSMASGFICDRLFGPRRRVLCLGAAVACGGVVLFFPFVMLKALLESSIMFTALTTFACGFVFMGIDTLLTGAVVLDIAERNGIQHNTAAVSGVVGGLGSFGSILQGSITAVVSSMGWGLLFFVLTVFCGMGLLALLSPIMLERAHVSSRKFQSGIPDDFESPAPTPTNSDGTQGHHTK